MIKLCFYGSCGHSSTVFESKRQDILFAGCCAGGVGEPGMEGLLAQGQSMKEYSALEKMLDTESPQVLVVDNSYGQHLEPILLALERGIAVYCDKPAVCQLDELVLLRRILQKTNGILWTMQTMRYESTFYTAKELIASGAIGAVRLINAQKSYKLGRRPPFFYDPRRYGGTIPWVGIHGIDLALWMADCYDCRDCYGRAWAPAQTPCPELATLSLLTLETGVLCSVSADYFRPSSSVTHGDDRLRVVGDLGIVEVLRGMVFLLGGGNSVLKEMPLSKPEPIFDDFLFALSHKGQGRLFSMEQALAATEAALLCQQSALEANKE